MAKRIKTRITVDGKPLCVVGTIADKLRLGSKRKCSFDNKSAAKKHLEEIKDDPFLEGKTLELVEHPDADYTTSICPAWWARSWRACTP